MEKNNLNDEINEIKDFKKLAKHNLILAIVFFIIAIIVCVIGESISKFANFDSRMIVLCTSISCCAFIAESFNLIITRYFMLKRNVNFANITFDKIDSYEVNKSMLEFENSDEKLIIAKYTKGKLPRNNDNKELTETTSKYQIQTMTSDKKYKEIISTIASTVLLVVILLVVSFFVNDKIADRIGVFAFTLVYICIRNMMGNFIIKKYQMKYIVIPKVEYTNDIAKLLGNDLNENDNFIIADIKNLQENAYEILENIIATF